MWWGIRASRFSIWNLPGSTGKLDSCSQRCRKGSPDEDPRGNRSQVLQAVCFALASPGPPICDYLVGIRGGSRCPSWIFPRHAARGVAAGALQSFCAWWPRSGPQELTEKNLAEYHNPKNEPGVEKRLLIVFALMFVGIAIMQYLGPKPAPQPPKPETSNGQPQQQQPSAKIPPSASAVTQPISPKAAPVAGRAAHDETEIVVENDLYRVVFSNRGAQVRSWVLKKFKNDKGAPLDMVNPVTAASLGRPLSLFTYDPDLRKKLNDALFVPSATGSLSAPATLSFEYADGDTQARKKFEFDQS